MWNSLSRGSPTSGYSWKMDKGASMFCHNNWCARSHTKKQNRIGQKSSLYINRFYEMTWRTGPENRKETKNDRPLHDMVPNPNFKFDETFDICKYQGSVLITQALNYKVLQSIEPTGLDAKGRLSNCWSTTNTNQQSRAFETLQRIG